MHQHAFVIEGSIEEGISYAERYIEKTLGMKLAGNPDVVTLRYGLLTAEDARSISSIAASAPLSGGKKAIIIATGRAYHEAQNALLKIFEEPPEDTFLFLVLPTLGSLLPTLRSRVAILSHAKSPQRDSTDAAEQFIRASREKRSAIIKKLSSGKDEDERRENREEAIGVVNGVEQAALVGKWESDAARIALLEDIATLRAYLYDRSAPVRMILEHLSLMMPKNLK